MRTWYIEYEPKYWYGGKLLQSVTLLQTVAVYVLTNMKPDFCSFQDTWCAKDCHLGTSQFWLSSYPTIASADIVPVWTVLRVLQCSLQLA